MKEEQSIGSLIFDIFTNIMSMIVGIILGGFTMVAIMTYGVVVSGCVVMNLWAWFMVPLGLPVLGYLQSAGISLIPIYLTRGGEITKNKYDKVNKTMVCAVLLRPWLILLTGFILYSILELY